VSPIGPQHRKAGAQDPKIERALLYTAPGQADLAAPDLNRTCGDCACFQTTKMCGKGRCSLYQRRMGGKVGAPLSNTQTACKAFEPRGP
jgi:hypothetical protein